MTGNRKEICPMLVLTGLRQAWTGQSPVRTRADVQSPCTSGFRSGLRFLATERLAKGRIRKSGSPRISIQSGGLQFAGFGIFHEKTVVDRHCRSYGIFLTRPEFTGAKSARSRHGFPGDPDFLILP